MIGNLCNNPRVRLKILCIKETILEPRLLIYLIKIERISTPYIKEVAVWDSLISNYYLVLQLIYSYLYWALYQLLIYISKSILLNFESLKNLLLLEWHCIVSIMMLFTLVKDMYVHVSIVSICKSFSFWLQRKVVFRYIVEGFHPQCRAKEIPCEIIHN